jgi:hypothetical protein
VNFGLIKGEWDGNKGENLWRRALDAVAAHGRVQHDEER